MFQLLNVAKIYELFLNASFIYLLILDLIFY